MTKSITVPAGQSVTITIQANTTGQTEAKATSPVVATRKASGTTPLYRASYTSKSGRTDTYGVFWEGMKDGQHRVGLKPLTNSGRMYKYNRRNTYSQGFFVPHAEIKPLS